MAEFVLLFVVGPAILWGISASGSAIPVLPLLVVTGLFVAVFLWRSAPERLRHNLLRPWSARETRRVAFQLVLGAAGITAIVLYRDPQRFLDFPLKHTGAWLGFLALYPLLSVIPQELFFRAYFFHRYASLLRNPAARVIVSAVVFGCAHAFYGNGLTVALATIGGLCFAWTFARTGSLALVVLEHSAYGVLLFSLGLGRLFYSGPWVS